MTFVNSPVRKLLFTSAFRQLSLLAGVFLIGRPDPTRTDGCARGVGTCDQEDQAKGIVAFINKSNTIYDPVKQESCLQFPRAFIQHLIFQTTKE